MFFSRFFIVFSLILLLAVPFIGYGQQAAVRVKDGKTGQPVPFAHVLFEGLSDGKQLQGITDEKGGVPVNILSRSKVTISYVGYETLIDTIDPGRSVILVLNPKIQNMNEVVVTAQYAPQRVDQSIYKVKVINSRQIEQKAANNLTDLLNSELNIRTVQNGALGTNMSLQGLSGEHIKFLVDGVPVIGRMDGNIDISQLNLYNVDHIEVIEGPMSVVYGSNALAGVINIITKENKNTTLSAYGRGYLESVGIYNFDLGASYKYRNNVFSFSGGRNFFDGYSDNDTLRSQRWKPKRQYFLDGYYIYSRPKMKFKVSSSYFDEKLQSKGDLQWPYFETAFDSYFYTLRSTSKLEYNQQVGTYRYLNAMASYSYYSRIKETYLKDLTTLEETPIVTPTSNDTTKFHNVLVRATFSKSNNESKLNYQLGFDLNSEIGIGKRITDEKQQMGDYAAFLSAQYQPWKWFSLQPGIRFIYNTNYPAPLVYSLNLKFSWREHYNVRASYSRGFRAPSLKELYLFFVDVNHNIQGNPDLESENSHNVNLSFQYFRETLKSYISAEVNFFYNNINNSITLAEAGGTVYTYINVNKYITQGSQVVVNYRLYPWMNFRTGAGITGRYDSFDEEMGAEKDFYYSPDAMAAINYKWLKTDIDFTLDYKYTGKMPQFYINEEGDPVEGYISAFNTMDFTVQRSFFRNRLTIGAGVKNIFDNTTIPSVGTSAGVHTGGSGSYPVGWGRTVFVQASVNFNQF